MQAGQRFSEKAPWSKRQPRICPASQERPLPRWGEPGGGLGGRFGWSVWSRP